MSVRPLAPIDMEAARKQWAAWWSQCWSQDQRLKLMQMNDPGLPAFREVPALQQLLLGLLDEATRWSSQRHEEDFRSMVRRCGTGSGDDLGAIHKYVELYTQPAGQPGQSYGRAVPYTGGPTGCDVPEVESARVVYR